MGKAEELQRSPLFAGLLPEEIEMLSELTQQVKFDTGAVIFDQDEVGNCLYLLVEGSVDVVRKRPGGFEPIIATLTAPDFFGEMSLIDKEVRSATIRARTATTLLRLTNSNLHSFARVYKNGFTLVVINIARVLSNRLRETDEKLAERMQSNRESTG